MMINLETKTIVKIINYMTEQIAEQLILFCRIAENTSETSTIRRRPRLGREVVCFGRFFGGLGLIIETIMFWKIRARISRILKLILVAIGTRWSSHAGARPCQGLQ